MGHLMRLKSLLITVEWLIIIYLILDLPNVNSKSYHVNVVDYLEHYGYLKDQTLEGESKTNEVMKALVSFQNFSGTRITGAINFETVHKMKKSRCGMMDIEDSLKTHERKRRYILQGSRWFKHKISWRIMNSLPGVQVWKVRNAIRKAFQKWSSAADLIFTERYSGSADIMIRFSKRSHGDSLPFDGKGGVLAHAYYPHNNRGISGDIHFDAEDHFSLDSNRGRTLYWVALHEIGHSLGLDHSKNKESVMYPWYRRGHQGQNSKLLSDDVNGIQAIYGKPWRNLVQSRKVVAPKPTQPMRSNPVRECINQVTAAWMDHRQYTYFAKSSMVYVLDQELSPLGEPISASRFFPGVKKIDAIFVNAKKQIVVFENNRYFIFTEKSIVQGARPLTDLGLPSYIRNIDAAFTWHEAGKTYFFTGHNYWRYDPNTELVDSNYPKSISQNWKGIPRYLDAVFKWKDGKIYFFKGSRYYQLNNEFAGVEFGFPKHVSQFWFKCSSSLRIHPSAVEIDSNRNEASVTNPCNSLFAITLIVLSFMVL